LPYTHHYFKKFIALSWQLPGLSMRELDEVFAALAKSAFRCKFHLQGKFLFTAQ
jgi:hypothetical protein